MVETKPQPRKRIITGWRQVERRKAEIRTHQVKRFPSELLLLPPVKL